MLHSVSKCSGWASAGRRWPRRCRGNTTLFRSNLFFRSISLRTTPHPKKLDLPSLDGKWKDIWKLKASERRDQAGAEGGTREKMYILPMFPYPSGDLHLGHLRVYTISDVLARFRRLQGYNVVHPIGWDAFGLPAENAAIERGIDPASWTLSNIQKMKSQLEAMNGAWDWDMEFATCDSKFYKHTQQLFLLLHEHGLAYQAESMVNYDPVDKTVLANEQVDANGYSWRSAAKVEKRLLKQWFLKISEFREALLEDLQYLSKDGAWPERVLSMQKNWLGKSTGARVKFSIVAYNQQTHADIEVFTTRPDTLFGVQYIALASTHPMVKGLAKTDIELQAFLDTFPALPPDSKVGYLLPNVRATNPLAHKKSTPDAVKASLPIYVAPYVLGDYGDGAVMGVPGHDVRDHGFWKHNVYDDPVRIVISPSPDGSTVAIKNQPFVHQGFLTSHGGPFAGETSSQASKKIIKLLESTNMGSAAESWRLRDWLVSRQRYWGTPIPIVHCDSCGAVPVPDDQLPVVLPPVQSHWRKGKAGNPLDDAHDWVITTCPKCHEPAKRDTDTMDTFVDSSWYFMRFIDPKNELMPFSADIADSMLPVDLYIGGVEHAILHLLYARFISKFIATTGLWNSKNHGEPFKKVLTQGMVHGRTYSDPNNGRFLKPDEVNLDTPSRPVVVATGEPANISFEKMSKSKYNGVDPSQCMKMYGADATRAHILFQAPVSEVLEWDEEKITGVTRWLKRIYDHILPLRQLWADMENTPHVLGPEDSVKMFLIQAVEDADDLRTRKKTLPAPEVIVNDELKAKAIQRSHKELNAHIRLWRILQTTISSVTESYGETYALNTVVSDLMALTNAILEHDLGENDRERGISFQTGNGRFKVHKQALSALIQMMAPITPAFAEECWQILHPYTHKITPQKVELGGLTEMRFSNNRPPSEDEKVSTSTSVGRSIVQSSEIASVFDIPFPEPDGSLPFLTTSTQKCAVQVNGKLKFVLEINIPPTELEGENLEKWIVKEILQTEESKSKLTLDVSTAKKVVVVRRGKTVNFVK